MSVQAIHIWVSIHHMILFFCCTSLKWWHLQMLFYFFKILLFWVVRVEGVKKGKNGPKWQKIMSHFVSQELYHMWLWLLVHICKMMISPANFFIFFLSYFSGFSKFINKHQKKILRCAPPSSHVCDFFWLSYDLFCPNWSYQGQNNRNLPQIC